MEISFSRGIKAYRFGRFFGFPLRHCIRAFIIRMIWKDKVFK